LCKAGHGFEEFCAKSRTSGGRSEEFHKGDFGVKEVSYVTGRKKDNAQSWKCGLGGSKRISLYFACGSRGEEKGFTTGSERGRQKKGGHLNRREWAAIAGWSIVRDRETIPSELGRGNSVVFQAPGWFQLV